MQAARLRKVQSIQNSTQQYNDDDDKYNKLNNNNRNGNFDVESADIENSANQYNVRDNNVIFKYSYGISENEANVLLKIHGYNVLPEKIVPKWYIFLTIIIEPMPVMIWFSILIEAGLSKWMDMSILLAIQIANASIAFYETNKANEAVAALKASLTPEACVYRDGKWQQTDASLLVPGDLVLLSCGAAVPADCRVNSGTIDVDQAQLTGESLPVTMYKGSPVDRKSVV
jgi:H+-transporting ATPase